MKLRTGGVQFIDGKWHAKVEDQGPARGRVEGSRGGGGTMVTAGVGAARPEVCPDCGSHFTTPGSLATHRSAKHRESAG